MAQPTGGIVEVLPLVALPPGALRGYSYRVPPGMHCSFGARVRIPFGSRTVQGIVWNETGRPYPRLKSVISLVGPPLFLPEEQAWLEELARVSLESLALLVKAAVSVRSPIQDGMTVSVQKNGRAATPAVAISWDQDLTSQMTRAKKSQILVLVPELVVGDRIEDTCRLLNVPVYRFSQGMRITERRAVLEALCAGMPGAYTATHAGVFLPRGEVKHILVMETALPSHRQWDLHPRYDARVAAVLRAKTEHIPVTFHSSLPSFDLAAVATTNVKTTGTAPALKAAVREKSPDDRAVLLPEIEFAIRETVKSGGSAFLFHPVLGVEREYRCGQCGTVAEAAKLFCPRCGSSRIRPRMTGTQAIERAAAAMFPGTPIVRLDRESLVRRPASRHSGFLIPHSCVCVATERAFAVLRGTPFAVSVIIDGDRLCSSPLYDAGENAVRTIARIAALTIPPHTRTLFVQTTRPRLALWDALDTGTLDAWMTSEADDRATLLFPPYASLIRLTREFPKEAAAEKSANAAVDRIAARHPNIRTGLRIVKTRTVFRGDILLRGTQTDLWNALKDVPSGWTQDPIVPLAELMGQNTE